MAKNTTARKPKDETAAQIAARGVAELFEGIILRPDSFPDAISSTSLEPILEAVSNAVEREHGDMDRLEDAGHAEYIGRETGYLVGLHVGLHLRRG